ncbi:MAG: PP2C family protein-serine/threonine phosphatase [Ectothiorhodospiraceae bacterium]|nr:PP2C family protein-serine/threonine phosphatase [Ectothiorhodospiraceae bacterium]MCH8504822.1 PP2C family protein-serine/threonine phosphatase [Ectothiorhodospiraceae bacterium]
MTMAAGGNRIPVTSGLTFRQAAVTLVIVLLLGLIAAIIELASELRVMRGEIRQQTMATLNLVRGPAAEAAYQFNDELAGRVVGGLFANREIQQVALRDNFGGVIAQREREAVSDPGPVINRLFGGITDYAIELHHGTGVTAEEHVGYLEVTLAESEIASSFMERGVVIVLVGLAKALIISALVVLIFYFMITRPLLRLHSAIGRIDPNHPGQWPRPSMRYHDRDELGQIVAGLDDLMHNFQRVLAQRDKAHDENARLGAELDVSRRIQQILLPSTAELDEIHELDIATYMEPAEEVGGDYYDILRHDQGVRIGIGDVTGHGLESGVVMLMTQSAVRTTLASREADMSRVMEVLNNTIYNNVQRMGSGKNLTLALLDYESAEGNGPERGQLRISGQHETVIVVRSDGRVEIIDTDELGFPIGLVEEVVQFVNETRLTLQRDDVVVLYTDGITEAADEQHGLYGHDRLVEIIVAHHGESAEAIKDAIIADVKRHMGTQTLYDDLTLVVLKQN